MEFNDHFSSRAARYAQYRPSYPAALFDHLASLAPSRRLAWDCACGSGQATIDLAQCFERVIATDASAAQIAGAKRATNVEYRIAHAEDCGLDESSVDLITVAQALHWLNIDAFYAEARRVLRPGGILAVWTYAMSHLEGEEVDVIAQDFYQNIIGPYWPPERKLVEDEYRSLDFPKPELLAPKFRMETHWTLDQWLGYLSSWSGTKNYVEARGEDPVERLRSDLERVWGGAERRRRIEWPLAVRIWKGP